MRCRLAQAALRWLSNGAGYTDAYFVLACPCVEAPPQPSTAGTAPSRRGSSETVTVRLPGGLPRHGVPPWLACASLHGRCDLSHTLWSPERGTFLRISDACQKGTIAAATFSMV